MPADDLGQGGLQAAGLAGEDQRGEGGQRLEGLVEGVRVGPVRLLLGREIPPSARSPRPVHSLPAWRIAAAGSKADIGAPPRRSLSSGRHGPADRDLRGHVRSDPRRAPGRGRQRQARPAPGPGPDGGRQCALAEGGRAGRQLGRGPPGPGRRGRWRRARAGGQPARDRPGRGVLHGRHPRRAARRPAPKTSCS